MYESPSKLFLLQNTKGQVLNFVEVILDVVTVEECLGQSMVMVRPSITSIMRKLFEVKQNNKETIPALIIQFKGVALESGVEEDKLKEAFVDALLPHWQFQARDLLATTPGMSSN